jgi:hypothetical protein
VRRRSRRSPYTGEQKLRIETSGFGWERRQPIISLPMIVARTKDYTCTAQKFGICPSFKGNFLSPLSFDSRTFCIAVGRASAVHAASAREQQAGWAPPIDGAREQQAGWAPPIDGAREQQAGWAPPIDGAREQQAGWAPPIDGGDLGLADRAAGRMTVWRASDVAGNARCR